LLLVNDPTKSAIHATASRQASERGKQPINVFRCSVHVTANGIIRASVISGGCRPSRIGSTTSGASRVSRSRQVVACALSFYAHVFFDKEYHVEGSRMQRFAWFKRKQELHFVHHRHANSNFAVIHFFWDRVLGTYRRPDTRRMDSTQNQVPFLPNRAPLSEGW
jgi:hypothetical protein